VRSHAEVREHLLEAYGWAVPVHVAAPRTFGRTSDPTPAIEEAAQQVGLVLDTLFSEVERRLRLVLESQRTIGSPARIRDEESGRLVVPSPLGPHLNRPGATESGEIPW
jgi:hypothetical protein